MSNALVKIGKEAKRIKRLHPNKHKKWKGYIQEASAKYRAGTIGKRKSAKPKKRKAVHHKKRAVSRKREVSRVGAVRRKKVRAAHRRVTRTRKRKVGAVRRRSNGGSGISTTKMLLLGGLAVGAYLLLKPKTSTPTGAATVVPGAPPLVTTTNPVRNTQANEIVAYAAAGGLAIDAIIKLINAINSSPDTDVKAVYDNINSGGGIPQPWIA